MRTKQPVSTVLLMIGVVWIVLGIRPAAVAQNNLQSGRDVQQRLSVHPQADKERRRLGKRFTSHGKEKSVLDGVLTVGADQNQVRITRTQEDDGEHIEVVLNGHGKPTRLTWTAADGVITSEGALTADLRALAEHIVLDSPDQFILAQLRGASYSTIAHDVRPAEAGGNPNYTGPVWDVIRVGEPEDTASKLSQNRTRLYYINTSTALIDKVVSQDAGGTMVAEILGWTDSGGELVPGRITWTQNGKVVMDLGFNNVLWGPK